MSLLKWLSLYALFIGATSAFAKDVTIAGQKYVSIKEVAKQCGLSVTVTEEKSALLVIDKKLPRQARLVGPSVTMVFTEKKRDAIIAGTKIVMTYPVALGKDNQLYLSRKDLDQTLTPLLFPQKIKPAVKKIKKICIDAGHGGKDKGAENSRLGLREKQLTLDLAQRLKGELERMGFNVVLTRSTDNKVELEERPLIANQSKCDLFISLHFNSAIPAAKGIETFCLTPAGQPGSSQSSKDLIDSEHCAGNQWEGWSLLCANYVQRSLVSETGSTDRGVKRARFVVLKTLNCPGILIEGGFLSNSEEGNRIGTPAYRNQLALAIAHGIEAYDRTINRLIASKAL
jgi:N-acetylmuramoyl-L-alanine amidase